MRKSSSETHEVSSDIAYLVSTIRPQIPLLFSRSWAATPRFLLELYLEIRRKKPNFVLDLGSGMTTLITAFALRANGCGRVMAWDHLEEFAAMTRELLDSHGLSDVATVQHRQLVSVVIEDDSFLWYEIGDGVEELIDILVVDGPPRSSGTMARLPALPLFKSRLSDTSVIFLDDVNRNDETLILEKWTEMLPGSVSEISKSEAKSQFAIIRCVAQRGG